MSDRISEYPSDPIDPVTPHNISPNDSTKNKILPGCTEWIPYVTQVNNNNDVNKQFAASSMISLSESLFWEISNIALAQGRLQRKILLNNKQEVWRDMYVILEKDRIWMFSQNLAARAALGTPPEKEHLPPSYIPLPSHNKSQSRLIAQIVDSNVFSITISYGVVPNNGPSSVSTAVTINELTTTLTFRTKSMDIAEYWVKTIYRVNERIRLQLQKQANLGNIKQQPQIPDDLLTDNDIIADIEQKVCKAQLVISDAEIKLIGKLSTFEGMMQCSYLRGYFQKYLMTESLEETLLFWEYAEDYRRGHPQTQDPFSFGIVDNCKIESADGVRQWAESIYLSFVEAYAFLQVSQCDTKEMDRIGDLIKGKVVGEETTETDEQLRARIKDIMLPHDLFNSIQRSAFCTMKYNFYPEFVKQPNYSKLLRASLHAQQRSQKRLNLFSSYLKSDAEPPNARGIIIQHATELTPVSNRTEVTSVRFPVFNFMTRGRQSTNVSKDKTVDVKSLTPVQLMVTPWRKRMSTARTDKEAAEMRVANSKTWGVQRMMATSAIAKRNKITWMPEWWWDYCVFENLTTEQNETIRSVWVAEEMRMNAEAAQRARKHRSAAKKQKKKLEEAAAAAEAAALGQIKEQPEESESDSEAEKVVVNTNGNAELYALAQEGFDSDHSFDGGKIGPSGNRQRRRSSVEEVSGEELYRCPSWMPQNVDIVREEIESKLLEYNKLLSNRNELNNNVHRDLLLKLQARDFAEVPRLSDGGSSHPYTNAATNGVYRSHPVHNAQETSNNNISSESKAELRKAFMSTNFQPYQPQAYLNNPGLPCVGTVLLSAAVRCRYYKRKKPKGPPLVSSNTIGSPTSSLSFSARYQSVKVNPIQIEGSTNNANISALREAMESNGTDSGSPTHIATAAIANNIAGRRQRSPSDEFLGQGIAGVEWVKQFALVTIFLGEARICLYDPITLLQTCSINLSSVVKITPTVNQLHSIDVFDCYGLNWQLIPEGIDEDDNRNIAKRWLEFLAIITLPTTEITYIVKSGYLNKRGRYNKAFKQRWFVLTSDYKLRYYKDDSPSSQFKGEIVFEPSTTAYDVIRFNKEIVMNMKKIDRTFTLMADDAKISEEWVQLIYQLLLIRDSTPQQPVKYQEMTGTIPEVDDEAEDEDED